MEVEDVVPLPDPFYWMAFVISGCFGLDFEDSSSNPSKKSSAWLPSASPPAPSPQVPDFSTSLGRSDLITIHLAFPGHNLAYQSFLEYWPWNPPASPLVTTPNSQILSKASIKFEISGII